MVIAESEDDILGINQYCPGLGGRVLTFERSDLVSEAQEIEVIRRVVVHLLLAAYLAFNYFYTLTIISYCIEW